MTPSIHAKNKASDFDILTKRELKPTFYRYHLTKDLRILKAFKFEYFFQNAKHITQSRQIPTTSSYSFDLTKKINTLQYSVVEDFFF